MAMRFLRSRAITAALSATILLLPGCKGGKSTAIDVVAIGEPTSLYDGGVRISGAAQLLRGATAQGLVSLDQQGQVVPGLADRWIVTDDGLSYIFRLNEGARLGRERLGAEPVRASLMQALSALRATAFGKDLGAIDEVRAMTARVIEIRLSRPQPQLLMLLAQPELGLTVKGSGSGPMALRRDGTVAYLDMLEPERRGLPTKDDWQSEVRPLRFRALPVGLAIARFERGEADVVLGGRLENFPLANASGLTRGALRLDPAIGLLGFAVMNGNGFLASAENREAIAMAIDRDALPAALGLGGWTMTDRILPAGLADAPDASGARWPNLDLAERQSIATARVARWRNGKVASPKLRIGMPVGRGSEILFTRLAGDLAKIGLDTVRVGPTGPADLRLIDATARYPTAIWFFNQLSCGVLPGPCSREADELVLEALENTDPLQSAATFSRAEKELAQSNVYIPLGSPIRWSLVAGNVTGIVSNPFATHPLMPMALLPK
jgi:ABC-type transport system substrate-binding protein